jgi:hypothetical protein
MKRWLVFLALATVPAALIGLLVSGLEPEAARIAALVVFASLALELFFEKE